MVESLPGEDLRGLPIAASVDDSRNDDGVSGAVVLCGDRTDDGSRETDMDVRRSLSVSPPGGEMMAGHNDLSVGNPRP